MKCNSPGELVPNRENCRKYFKCSNGEPSLQSCPGTLIFDPVLKICNWPDSTTCIADLLPKKKKVNLESFDLNGDDLDLVAKHIISDDVPISLSPTVPSVSGTRKTTKKISKRILSLFHTKDRKFTRLRNSRPNSSENVREKTAHRPRISPFKNRGESISKDNQASVRVSPFRNRNKSSKDDSSVRLNLFRKKEETSSREQESKVKKTPFKVRAESSVTSVTSSVRVSPFRIREGGSSSQQKEVEKISFRKSEEEIDDSDEVRPFSNGRGGNQFQGDRPFSNGGGGGGSSIEQENFEDRPFRNRGGGFELDDEQQLKAELFFEDEEITTKKPKSKLIKCHTGASNELYANPRNCRKYYKCQNGSPSLQSCPANLIFDTNLKICNWPTASTCIEDPEAILPEHASSDRAPPKPIRQMHFYEIHYFFKNKLMIYISKLPLTI